MECIWELLQCYHEELKDIASVIQSLTVSIGILVGGIWTYLIFIRNRQIQPRANLCHAIYTETLQNGKTYLRVSNHITNIGSVMINLEICHVWIQQILPPVQSEPIKTDILAEMEWPLIRGNYKKWQKGKCEIEPGETDQIIFDFIVEPDVKVVSIYTHCRNEKKKKPDLGWSLTSIYDLQEKRYGEKTR